ncbi:MAG TPA: aldehyde dehydrogenase family protein [Acidimicrobiales bacterium]|nr:aldehyde dehydrogenase family protein [Acidimicrobiales bacterium]
MGEVRRWDRIFVGGAWVEPSGTGTIDVVNPFTEDVCARVPRGDAVDAGRAVDSARDASGTWSATPVEERAAVLTAIGQGVVARTAELGAMIAEEVGMPINLATMIQVGLPAMTFSTMASLLDGFPYEERVGNSLVVREPVGVVAAMTAWNYPLHLTAAKVAAAIAAGCTVVLKPSELAPSTAFVLAEIAHAAGLPAGVLNVVTGAGPVVGEHLARSPGVAMVSFTGSTEVGRLVAAAAATTVKRVALELGGKSANLILDDADLPSAVRATVTSAFLNSGQTCSALSRMLVPRPRLGEAERLAAAAAEDYVPGDPLADGTRLGPLVSAAQRDRVRAYIASGLEEGARLVAGGSEPPEGLDRGYFVRATVLSDVRPGMRVEQEEIFGPVLSIVPYDTEDEAVAIANGTIYGLHAGVWSGDMDRAVAVARRLRSGMVEVNGGIFNPLAPWGGCKQSGHGRELGRWGIEEFLETKSMQL